MRLAGPTALAAALAALAWAPPSAAHASGVAQSISFERQQLYTSTTAYCAPPGPILISSMDVKYFRKNSSLDFQLTAAALPNDLNMSAELNLFAYGRDWFNMTIDLCEIGGGTLCPVPQYNFSGSGVYNVPQKFASQVPSIVYSVPDIEALGVLRLVKQGTNETVGCMQITLANGLTARSRGVLWGTVAFTLVAAVAAVLTMFWRNSLSALQWRVVDVVSTLHTVVLTSMLTLIVPRVFHEYSLSFAWSFALIYMRPMQAAIYKSCLRHGSNDSDVPYAALLSAQYARLANLYPAASLNPDKPAVFTGSSGTFSDLLSSVPAHAKRALYAPNTGPGGEMVSGGQSAPVVWAAQNYGFSHTGIFYYTESLNISPNSAFLTVLVNWLLVVCIAIAAVLLACIFALLVHAVRRGRRRGDAYERLAPDEKTRAPGPPHTLRDARGRRALQPVSRIVFQLARPTFLRLVEIATTPLLLFIFFQWRHATGWPSHVAAAFTFAALLAAWVGIVAPMFVHVARTRDPHTLYYSAHRSPYDAYTPAARHGTLAQPYRPKYFWFGAVHLVCGFIRVCFVAFPQRSDLAMRQAIGLLVVDVLLFLALVILRPGRDRFTDFVQYILALFRIVGWALCVALATESNIWGIPRAVLGFVLMAVTSLAVVFIFLVFVWDVLVALLSRHQRWTRRFAPLTPGHAADESQIEASHDDSAYKDASFAAAPTDASHKDASDMPTGAPDKDATRSPAEAPAAQTDLLGGPSTDAAPSAPPAASDHAPSAPAEPTHAAAAPTGPAASDTTHDEFHDIPMTPAPPVASSGALPWATGASHAA